MSTDSPDQNDIQRGLDEWCHLVGDPLADSIIRDVSAIVSEGINASADTSESKGFYEQVVKPYITAHVYKRVAEELQTRHTQNIDLYSVAWQRRYSA